LSETVAPVAFSKAATWQALTLSAKEPPKEPTTSSSATAKGIRLADEAMPRHAAAELHLLRMFDASQREVLSGLLGQMMTGNAPETGPEPAFVARMKTD
jgi:hypothetical protein